jgi:hypothetical protein
VECVDDFWELQGWGESTPNSIPKNATEWTTAFEADQTPASAFILSDGSTMRAQKWAEILEEWPALNYERPCGATDRAIENYDEAVCEEGELTIPARWPEAPDCVEDYAEYLPARKQFVVRTWEYNFREYGEYQRLFTEIDGCGCDPVDYIGEFARPITGPWESVDCGTTSYTTPLCGPPVAVVTPNAADIAAGWNTFSFPDPEGTAYNPQALIDHRYGNYWLRQVVQAMPDPFWQRPVVECNVDEVVYDMEATPPYVEAVCVPEADSNFENALELEEKCITCKTVEDINAEDGRVETMPAQPSQSGLCETSLAQYEETEI